MLDPHTAVGVAVYEKYRRETGDGTFAVVDATASPFKFSRNVLLSLGFDVVEGADELLVAETLGSYTNTWVHPALAGLSRLPLRHSGRIAQSEMKTTVEDIVADKSAAT